MVIKLHRRRRLSRWGLLNGRQSSTSRLSDSAISAQPCQTPASTIFEVTNWVSGHSGIAPQPNYCYKGLLPRCPHQMNWETDCQHLQGQHCNSVNVSAWLIVKLQNIIGTDVADNRVWRQYFCVINYFTSSQLNICCLYLQTSRNGACYVHAKRSQEGTGEAATSKICSFWLQLSYFCKSNSI